MLRNFIDLDRLAVYKTYVSYSDNSGGKIRPIIILTNESNELSFDKYALAVYSFKDKFVDERKRAFYMKFLYKIKDAKVAGLNPKWVSYVDVVDVKIFPFNDLFKEAKYLGELSIEDSLGVINKYNQCHSE